MRVMERLMSARDTLASAVQACRDVGAPHRSRAIDGFMRRSAEVAGDIAISIACAPFVLVVGGAAVCVVGGVVGAPVGVVVGGLVSGIGAALGQDPAAVSQMAMIAGYSAAGVTTLGVGVKIVASSTGESI